MKNISMRWMIYVVMLMLVLVIGTQSVTTGTAQAEEDPCGETNIEKKIKGEGIYECIKHFEEAFDVFEPVQVVRVGTFDAATGKFKWYEPNMVIETRERVNPYIPCTHEQPRPDLCGNQEYYQVAKVNAVNVKLRFDFINNHDRFSVIATGDKDVTTGITPRRIQPVVPYLPSGEMTVDVGQAKKVNWTVRSGDHVYSDTLEIERPPIIGVGAFTIPVFPLSVVYAPPKDKKEQNQVVYSRATSVGTTITMSTGRHESTTTPTKPSKFQGVNKMKEDMDGILNILNTTSEISSKIPTAEFKALSEGSKGIADGLNKFLSLHGTANAQLTKGNEVSEGSTFHAQRVAGVTFHTNAHLGPGKGDRIYYLQNVRVAWVTNNGEVKLTILGWETVGTPTVEDLMTSMNNGALGLRHKDIQALLSCNS
jgi:hypothetical protein